MNNRSRQFLRDAWLCGYTTSEIITILNKLPGPKIGLVGGIEIADFMNTLDQQLEQAVPSSSH